MNGMLGEVAELGAYLEFHGRGVFVVVVRGDADIHTAPELRECLDECRASPAVDKVVVDLTETSFLDSAALGVLMPAGRALRRQGVPMEVACEDHNVRRLLAITGLDRLFLVHGSVEGALATSFV